MKLYEWLVLSNDYVKEEYQSVIIANPEAHEKNRLKSWLRLIKLNIKYRVFRMKPRSMVLQQNQQVNQPEVESVATPMQAPDRQLNQPVPIVKFNSFSGAESKIDLKKKPEHLIKDLLEYDVVSFDIFDTLIFRPVANPKDVFKLLGEQHQLLEFNTIRVRSESEARGIRFEKYGDTEVTLKEIYDRVEFYTGIPAQEGMKAELEMEKKLLFVNPYMKRVFDMLRESNRRIIAVSDMYLGKDILERWLEDLGYEGFEEIYVSVDCKCSKKDGKLFRYVEEALGDVNIVHLDDSWNAILQARACQWTAIHYKNVNALGIKYRTPEMSALVGSGFAGVVNSRLYNGIQQFSPLYEYGYTYGGLFVLGYCNWIHDYCKKNDIDKILFMSRDGFILKKIYDKRYEDVKSEYFYFSRIAASRISIKSYPYLYLESFILKKYKNAPMPISYYLELMDILFLKDELGKWGFSSLDIVDDSTVNRFVEFIVAHKDEVEKQYRVEIEQAKLYISKTLSECKKVAVVDIGWRGSSALALQKFIDKECDFSCQIIGLMAAAPYDVNIGEIQTGRMATYMFSTMHNANVLKAHDKFKADNAIYEFFLTATHGTLKRFEAGVNGELKFEFEEPDVENYPMIEEIQSGIEDFVDDYMKHWNDFEYMMDIPGNDAGVNIQNVVLNKKYIRELFKDFRYNMGIGGKTVPFEEILG